MRITPLDIQQKQFPTKLVRGFDEEEVYAFLDIVREEMEELIRENAYLKESLAKAEEQVRENRNLEQTLRETLITAQQMVEDYKDNARKEAELVHREAEMRAEEIVRAAQEKAIKIHEDIVDLKGVRRHFKEEMLRLIQSHARMLEFDNERESAFSDKDMSVEPTAEAHDEGAAHGGDGRNVRQREQEGLYAEPYYENEGKAHEDIRKRDK